MEKIKKFLKDNQWALLALAGLITLMAFALEIFAAAAEVIVFYVTFARL